MYAFGSGKYGKLGLYENREDNALVPQKIPNLKNIVQVAAGAFHSLALDSSGVLLSWGNFTDGKLGYKAEQNVFLAREIKDVQFYFEVKDKEYREYNSESMLISDNTPIRQISVSY